MPPQPAPDPVTPDPVTPDPPNPAPKTPTPSQKTQAQKQKDYENCFNQEVVKLKQQFRPELERIMNRGLRNTIIGAVGGDVIASTKKLLSGGIGSAIGVFAALISWKDNIEDFERDKLGPAREAAKKSCRDKAGL